MGKSLPPFSIKKYEKCLSKCFLFACYNFLNILIFNIFRSITKKTSSCTLPTPMSLSMATKSSSINLHQIFRLQHLKNVKKAVECLPQNVPKWQLEQHFVAIQFSQQVKKCDIEQVFCILWRLSFSVKRPIVAVFHQTQDLVS